jgi:hypothetical protein
MFYAHNCRKLFFLPIHEDVSAGYVCLAWNLLGNRRRMSGILSFSATVPSVDGCLLCAEKYHIFCTLCIRTYHTDDFF